MLSGSIRSYLNRWGVNSFGKVLLFTNNDDTYLTALDLILSGINLIGVVDTRDNPKIFNSKSRFIKVLK